MARHLILTSTLLAATLPLFAQTPQPAPTLKTRPVPAESVASSGTTITVSTQLVAVDVVVEDRDGHPIHGLKASDFRIEESKKPQSLKSFEEHTAANQNQVKSTPLNLPKGTFTDYSPAPTDSTLNILLLDTLNTPTADQSYVHYQLHEYLKKAPTGTRMAIFGLSGHLRLLQGFTSDPEILRNAVEHKTSPRGSVLNDNPSGSGSTPEPESDRMAEALAGGPGNVSAVVSVMQQFEAETASTQVQVRAQLTLEAFNQLARYLSIFPGRKNLIWFSGSFPLTIFPQQDIPDPFAVVTDAGDALRQTSNLLARSRVAVYPIDARGIQSSPLFDTSRTGHSALSHPNQMVKDYTNFATTSGEEHATMEQVAEDTGGHAFYNTNGLAGAVTKALDAGSNYYTLTYSPTDHVQNNGYRSIHVQLQGEAESHKLKLAYRHGYYTSDNITATKHDPSSILSINAAVPPANPGARYGMAVMQRGAPTPSEVVFKVRVLPNSNVTESMIAPNNQLDPQKPISGPFRLYNVDFAVLAGSLQLAPQPDGKRAGVVEFVTYVFDADGKLLNVAGDSLNMDLTPDLYKKLIETGLGFNLKVSVPAKSESFLRIAVHDLASGRFGIVEIPTSDVAYLAPIPPPAAVAPPKR